MHWQSRCSATGTRRLRVLQSKKRILVPPGVVRRWMDGRVSWHIRTSEHKAVRNWHRRLQLCMVTVGDWTRTYHRKKRCATCGGATNAGAVSETPTAGTSQTITPAFSTLRRRAGRPDAHMQRAVIALAIAPVPRPVHLFLEESAGNLRCARSLQPANHGLAVL